MNKRKFLTFHEARNYTRSQNFKNQKDWQDFCKSGNRPDDIPASPEKIFKKKWLSWGDWLGTGRVASVTISNNYLSFEKARHEAVFLI